MNQYRTAEIAKMMGIHPNTVRLYEKCMLIPVPDRLANGYRLFTDLHVEQFRLARAALRVEVLQNGLRKQAVEIIKISAQGNYSEAKRRANAYLQQIELETHHAEEAIEIARQMLIGSAGCITIHLQSYTRKEAAQALQITIDTLRNWELNGLIAVKRKKNGYRIYDPEDIRRLKIIRSLRCANYSLSAILRMLHALSHNPNADLRESIDTPADDEDVITACDKLLTSLSEARVNMRYVISQIEKIEQLD